MSEIPEYKLNNGATIPGLGFGTWQDPGKVADAVVKAVEVGYRHIDCAYRYENEDDVGAGLKEVLASGKVKRNELFVTGKLWSTYHSRVEENLDKTLKSLGLDYLDLYLMHWPVAFNPKGNHEFAPRHADGSRDFEKDWTWIDTWKSMEKLLDGGKVKAIGLSNVSVPFLEQLLPQVTVMPAVNQIESHPYLPQQEIVDFCKAKGIHVTAYSPLGSAGSPLLKEDAVIELAKKYQTGPANILISWHISRGISVLAKSVTPEYIEKNFNIIKLDQTDVAELSKIHKIKGVTRYVWPDFGVYLGFPDKS